MYKTLQRSTLLYIYTIDLCDWYPSQINDLKILQAKALRSHLDADLHCPKSIIRTFCSVEPLEARMDLHILLYYAKLNRCKPDSLLDKINKYHSKNLNALLTSFHNTLLLTLKKYNLESLWNKLPQLPHTDIRNLLKKAIWINHRTKDVRTCKTHDCFFSSVLLNLNPKAPYQNQILIRPPSDNKYPQILDDTKQTSGLFLWGKDG